MPKRNSFLLIALSLLLIINCAVNIELIGTQREPISRGEVKEYDDLPIGAEKIGNVTVSLGSYFGGVEAYSQIKKKAAKVGANGYVIISKEKSPAYYSGLSGGMYKFTAIVFYIDTKNSQK